MDNDQFDVTEALKIGRERTARQKSTYAERALNDAIERALGRVFPGVSQDLTFQHALQIRMQELHAAGEADNLEAAAHKLYADLKAGRSLGDVEENFLHGELPHLFTAYNAMAKAMTADNRRASIPLVGYKGKTHKNGDYWKKWVVEYRRTGSESQADIAGARKEQPIEEIVEDDGVHQDGFLRWKAEEDARRAAGDEIQKS